MLSFHKNNVYCAIPLEYFADHSVPTDVYNDCVSFYRQGNDIIVALTTWRVTDLEKKFHVRYRLSAASTYKYMTS